MTSATAYVGFHRVRVRHGKIIIALNDRGCFFERLLDVAPLDFVGLANIRPFACGNIAFKTTQRPGFEFLLVQERRIGSHRLFRSEDAFQFFVLDVDKFQCFERSPFIDRDHGGHRFAGITHFFNRQKRMIFDGMTEIGIQSFEIVAGNDAINAWMRFGTGLIDGDNFRMGVGTAENLGVGHADELQVGDVLRLAGDFDPAVAARDRMIDDMEIGLLFGAHFFDSFDITSAAR